MIACTDHRDHVYVIGLSQDDLANFNGQLATAGLKTRYFDTAQAFLAACDASTHGCIVMRLGLAESLGQAFVAQLDERRINMPVILLTQCGDATYAVQARLPEVIAFSEYPEVAQELCNWVQQAISNERLRCRQASMRQTLLERASLLTPREQQVMDLVVHGKLNKQIAAELSLSPKTIEVHRAHVMEKMQADSLADLVRMAVILETEALLAPVTVN